MKVSCRRLAWVFAGPLLALPGCGSNKGGGGDGDKTAPVVRIAFPPTDTTLTGYVTIFAEATDNIAVSHIDFHVDDQKCHTDSTMPYMYEWDCSVLADSSTHRVFAKAFDASGNSGVSDTLTVLVHSGDMIAPRLVLDLAVIDSTASSVTLRWTAPGDDGAEGRASVYDVRYIRTYIDPWAWETATQVGGEPVPSGAGTSETLVVQGLTSGTNYMFGIRACDDVGNWSGISNTVSTTTLRSGGTGR